MLQPLPISPTEFVQPANQRSETRTLQGIAYAMNSSSSTRAGQRRMRTETQPTAQHSEANLFQAMKDWEKFEKAIESSLEAFDKGNYKEALALFRKGKEIWNKSLVHALSFLVEALPIGEEESAQLTQLLPTIRSLVNAAFLEGEGYLLTLLSNQEGLVLADEGFKQVMSHIDDITTLLGFIEPIVPDDVETQIAQGYQLYRKFLLFALGKKDAALNGLKEDCSGLFSELYTQAASGIERDMFWDDDELLDLFFFKVLEQKFNTPLLPTLSSVDPNDEISLFIAGQYQDVLTLMEKRPELSNPELKAACLALLGFTQEAIRLLHDAEKNKTALTFYTEIMTAIAHLLHGDLQSALKMYRESFDRTMTVKFLMPLTIKGFQWESN